VEVTIDCRDRGAGKTHDLLQAMHVEVFDDGPRLVYVACHFHGMREVNDLFYAVRDRVVLCQAEELDRLRGYRRLGTVYVDDVDNTEDGLQPIVEAAAMAGARAVYATCSPHSQGTLDLLDALERHAGEERRRRRAEAGRRERELALWRMRVMLEGYIAMHGAP
jgi:hypothetical protein